MRVVSDLKSWFFSVTESAPMSASVRIYVIDVMARPHKIDLSDKSIVLAQAHAKTFVDYQMIGDWALWVTAFNQSHQHKQVIESMGRLSYDSCYRLLGRKIGVYEELADELPIITNHIHVRLNETLRTV